MLSYRHLSIQRKLQVTTLVAIAVALILSCAAFVSYDLMVFRHSLVRDLETLAEIRGSNSTAALSFGDQNAAGELLSALRAKPHIRTAVIYSADGKRFAGYRRAGEPEDSAVPRLRAVMAPNFGPDQLALFHRINLGDRPSASCTWNPISRKCTSAWCNSLGPLSLFFSWPRCRRWRWRASCKPPFPRPFFISRARPSWFPSQGLFRPRHSGE